MNSKLWFSADFHFSHNNVLHLCNRPFADIYEHDKVLIQNYNSVVSDNDDFFFLGDFAYKCSCERVVEILKKMNGRIHAILGNHDKILRQAVERGLLNDMLNSGKLEIFGLKAILEDPTIAISKMINIEGQLIFLSHYGIRSWPNSFRGSICLYGHSHSRLPSLYKSMDVGIDTGVDTGVDIETDAHKRFFPWSYEEIQKEMEKVTDSFSEDPSSNHNNVYEN